MNSLLYSKVGNCSESGLLNKRWFTTMHTLSRVGREKYRIGTGEVLTSLQYR